MGQDSKIEWTHHTFNPWRGCTKVSAGCANCYADALSKRNPRSLGVWGPNGLRVVAADSGWKQPLAWNRWAATGTCYHCGGKSVGDTAGKCEVCNGTGKLGGPYRARVFCASMADIFEGPETMPADSVDAIAAARDRLHALITFTPHLDWLLLTKRPDNAFAYYANDMTYTRVLYEADNYWRRRFADLVGIGVANPAQQRNRWLGTSVENQDAADKRIPWLLKCPAAVRFLSCEPLLGALDLSRWLSHAHGILADFYLNGNQSPKSLRPDLVIVGGESGPHSRPMHPVWPRMLRDQCQSAAVPFFFKQWGEFEPVTPLYAGRDDSAENGRGDLEMVDTAGHIWSDHDGQPNDRQTWLMERVGKHAAGRLLDGRLWDEMPTGAAEVTS